MKNKIIKILVAFVEIGIIVILIVFGIIIYQEFEKMQTPIIVENFISNITTGDTIEKNIKTPGIIDNQIGGIEDNNSKANVTYNNVHVNKYLYNQLEKESQLIYKAFESNKEAMKTGTAKIDLGEEYTQILSTNEGQDLIGKYYQAAIEAYVYDNPDVFYLNPVKMYLNIETIKSSENIKYNLYINSGNEPNYLADEFNSKTEIDTAISKVEQIRNLLIQKKTGNTYEDIKMVHDYLVDTIEYDESISKENIYNIYGALINKTSVCEGYSKALKYILDGMNIPCIMVIGTATNLEGKSESHAWNYINMENKWYAIDVTWDDPVVYGGGMQSDNSKTKYFMREIEEFNREHFPNGQFTEGGKVFKYPN